MDAIQKSLLEAVADLHEIPTGAYNIRANGQSVGRASSEHVEIVPKEGGKGIDIYIKEGTKNESVHIPVVLSQS
jgi:ribosomal protein S5